MRCYIPADRWSEGDIQLDPEESHHAQQVFRVRPGARLEVFDGEGRIADATVAAISGKKAVMVRVLAERTVDRPAVAVHLVQAVAREQKMDFILQKATELGVAGIHAVETTHAVVRLRPEQVGQRLERWRKITVSAAKQCGTPWLPELTPLCPLASLLPETASYDLPLVCSLETGARPLREVLDEQPGAPRRVCAFVGPEGDFTAEEYEAIRASGAQPVSLGSLVLRAETASLYVASVLRYAFPG